MQGLCLKSAATNPSKDRTTEFVKQTLAHAMSRDGSSGGTIRMAVITKEGVERFFVPGDQLPKLEDTV
ncbi:hypothetical protein NBRC10513_000669 [Rhodotorula toruloides]